MRTALALLFGVVLVFVGLRLSKVESEASRPPLRGELATLVEPEDAAAKVVYLAHKKEDCHLVDEAVEAKNLDVLQKLVQQNRAFSVPVGTTVKVLGDSFNERMVEVVEGPEKGHTGWLPFEWLKRVRSA